MALIEIIGIMTVVAFFWLVGWGIQHERHKELAHTEFWSLDGIKYGRLTSITGRVETVFLSRLRDGWQQLGGGGKATVPGRSITNALEATEARARMMGEAKLPAPPLELLCSEDVDDPRAWRVMLNEPLHDDAKSRGDHV